MNVQLSIDYYTKQLNPLALWDDPEQVPYQRDFHVIVNHAANKNNKIQVPYTCVSFLRSLDSSCHNERTP